MSRSFRTRADASPLASCAEVAVAVAECAALARAGVAGEAMWSPLLSPSHLGDPGRLKRSAHSGQSRPGHRPAADADADAAVGVAGALAAWAAGLAGTEIEPYGRAICAVEGLAREVGASPGDLLDRLGSALADHQDVLDAREAAAAGPRSTARVLQWLPLLGVALAFGIGANPVAVMLGGGVGTVAGVVGVGLIVAGRAWTGLLLRQGMGHLDIEAMVTIDVLAAALRVGLPIPAALEAASGAGSGPTAQRLGWVGRRLGAGAAWESAWQFSPQIRPDGAEAGWWSRRRDGGRRRRDRADPAVLAAVRRALALAWESGASAGPLLDAVAAGLRRAGRRGATLGAAQLSVRLLLPLGLCFLPALFALGLVPVVVSLLSDLTASW